MQRNTTSKINFNKLNESQKINFIKNLFFNHDVIEVLSILLPKEKRDLNIVSLIKKSLDDKLIIDKIREECNFKNDKKVRIYVYSKIISVLSFYNKNNFLELFLKTFNKEELRDIAHYEYQNKTEASINSIVFNKYCKKYEKEAMKLLALGKDDILMLTMGIKKYKEISKGSKNKRKILIPLAVISVALVSVFGIKTYQNNKLIKGYEGLIYPGIYLNEVNLHKKSVSDLEKIFKEEKTNIENGEITITNENGNYKFTYLELGIDVDYKKVLKEVNAYINDLSWLDKVSLLKSKKRNKTFYLKGSFNDEDLDNFISVLESKLNTESRQDGLVIDENYNVYYDKGSHGYKLNVSKTKENIKEALSNLTEESVIKAEGDVQKITIKNSNLSVINKKVSTYTTYFANTGNRGHNIVLASSRLNKTLLMPGEEFSYLKVVGPYSAANGYKPAPIYLNGAVSTANGGGVCQLTSTLYNAQLRAGLETVYRTNHIFAPDYVPKGLDATVYSTTTNFKFKNQYEYPVFITSYVKGNYLTVDIWTNDKALGNKTYEPYSVYSNGGYVSYLKEFENGKFVGEKYLHKSYYKTK